MAMISSSRASSRNSPEYIEYRKNVLKEILEEARIRGDIIDENYLLYHMRLKNIENYTRSKLYQDRLEIDSKNNYIRDFLPRYSRFQEEILDSLTEMEAQCKALSERDWGTTKTIQRDTKDGMMRTVILEETNHKPIADFMKIRAKVVELKQKHGEGQNIQISAVIVQKELAIKKATIVKLSEENKKLVVLATKDQK